MIRNKNYRQSTSGISGRAALSQKKYCEQENLSYWSFWAWYYKKDSEAADNKFIKIDQF